MYTLPWPLRLSIAAALFAAGRMAVAAPPQAADSNTTSVTRKEYVFRVEDDVFTGTVVTNDLNAKTITLQGHNPLCRETIERSVPRAEAGHARQANKPPPVKDSTAVFRVDPLSHVVLTGKLASRSGDIKPGDLVDVIYHKAAGGALIAESIQTAGMHPYDAPPAKASPKD